MCIYIYIYIYIYMRKKLEILGESQLLETRPRGSASSQTVILRCRFDIVHMSVILIQTC